MNEDENCVLSEQQIEVDEIISSFVNEQKDLSPEFSKVIDDNFWDLL
jgi:hypothetical protein